MHYIRNHRERVQEYEVSTPEVFGGKTVQVCAQLFTSKHHHRIGAFQVLHYRAFACEAKVT